MKKRTQKRSATVPSPPSKPVPDQDDALLDALRNAIPYPPASDEDAQAWLDAYDASLPLPSSLSDAPAAVELILGHHIPEPEVSRDPDPTRVQSLRRAARNGSAITPEIEEAMRQARGSTKEERK